MPKSKKEKITKDMQIGQIIEEYPKTFEVFERNGLHCVGCAIATYESIEDGAKVHGINVKRLLKELNNSVKE